MDRFVVFTYESFKQASTAYHLMLAGFVAFFVTETVELFGELEIIEVFLNMISITLILGDHIVLLSWLLKRRT